ncbi:pyridoxal-phosphate dependent enzyme [Robiginitalea sp. M366]|uniref:pyridoxal-phosphate dependent enzyme n=1 Tax=Robiginitalea aestuariiviva TaxID=3036903 RepID=UPI00240D7B85|nr:pyridoxal-phosphate dependent enzyme [Robiginitalea aestuariiviva]MDG1571716.1 pyridoxal-phosphate dependent enzyme [Robiginitalea aestuariiviva]
MASLTFTPEMLAAARELVGPHVHHTPVMHSRLLDQLAGAPLFFKCENFQRGGSYKLRGATHALLRLQEQAPVPAVVTHSSGNFAQALSVAAQAVGIPAHIVMPENAPAVKKAAVHTYGGRITECAPTLEAREDAAARISEETGAVFIHPSNDPMVMLGQGTACAELLEEVPDLECVVAPVGGGGLLGGTALACTFTDNACEPIGAEPLRVDDAYRSLQSGRIESNSRTDTVADGLRTVLGSHTFPVLKQYVNTIIRVEEAEIITAMRLVWERMKIVIEPSSAVALAAVLKDPGYIGGRKTGIIVSGGNVDLGKLPF